jgi:hypothetical protein
MIIMHQKTANQRETNTLNIICPTVKGVYLLIMGRFNRGLVLNKFFMDMIKYGWNILSSHTK